MIDLIEQHRLQIAELCGRYRVKRLEIFGSAASGDFDANDSDIDLFYEFDQNDVADIADRCFEFQNQLETLLGCKVDLVSSRHVKNPYFLEEANRHRQTLYAA
jgi:hypothetical protein